MDEVTAYEHTARNRHTIADLLENMSDEEWGASTLCEGWDVHIMAAHLLQPMIVSFPRFVVTALRCRGDTDAAIDRTARRLARRTRGELTGLLRAHADDQVAPRRVGPLGPFVESCVHMRDIARPLHVAVDVPIEDWLAVLDYLVSPDVAPALVTAGRLDDLRFIATDADWRSGAGAEVEGPCEALALAMTGRPAALADLTGPGVQVLGRRLEV